MDLGLCDNLRRDQLAIIARSISILAEPSVAVVTQAWHRSGFLCLCAPPSQRWRWNRSAAADNRGTMDRFDYIIIGGGSAGCVLANRLSADPRNRVALLEAGGRDDYIWIRVPVGYLYCIGNPRTDWLYRTETEEALGGRALAYPRGRVLGGCSSINGMIYMRGQAADYDGWRQAGNAGWGWDEVLPYFRKAEDHYAGPSEHHGTGGEIRVERQRLRWDILEAFQQAATEWGLPAIADFNRGDNEGSAFFDVTQRRGWRWSVPRPAVATSR